MDKNWEIKDGVIEFTEIKKEAYNVLSVYDQYNEDLLNIDREIAEYEQKIADAQSRKEQRLLIISDLEPVITKMREDAVSPDVSAEAQVDTIEPIPE